MSQFLLSLIQDRRAAVRAAVMIGLVLVSAAFFVRAWSGDEHVLVNIPRTRVKIARAISGHKVKLNTDERLVYAGIRSPFTNEPYQEESTRRNADLVDDCQARLRFDQRHHDRNDYLLAYVFVDGEFINETMVREGLAYVRLTSDTKRYADRLLSAQSEARKQKRGIWATQPDTLESSYPADPKYGNFHRASCEEAKKTKPERVVVFKSRTDALDSGYAPCSKCRP